MSKPAKLRPNEDRSSSRGLTRSKLPKTFEPKFWIQADGRSAVVKEIKARVERLKQDCGADSYQRELLCERAAFVAVQLETMERTAVEQAKLDPGVYGQMVNTFMGLLRALGLEKKVKQAGLRAYVAKAG